MGEEAGIEPNHSRTLQLQKVKSNGWTKARRSAFLTELAHSCNVRRAHDAAQVSHGAAYRLRRKDAGFAQQWQEALTLGYERLELALLRRALEVLGETELDEREEPVEKMTVAQAIDVMSKHRATISKGSAHRRRLRHVATQEETDAVLIKRIAMVKRQRRLRAAPVDGAALAAKAVTDGVDDGFGQGGGA